MNEEKKRNRPSKLEQLTPEQQSWILEIAAHSRQIDVIKSLKEEGIEVSTSMLSRFLQEHRERELMEKGEAMKGTVEALAERGRSGKLREGTLEAVRQRIYERALVLNSPEEARALYAELVKEEAKLKEVELEARKVAALEQQVKLQGLRIEVDMAKARLGRGMKSAEIVESKAVGATAGELGNGDGGNDVTEAMGGRNGSNATDACNGEKGDAPARAQIGNGGAGRVEAEKERLMLVLQEVSAIANRGGDPAEKILELRVRIGEEMKGMEGAVGVSSGGGSYTEFTEGAQRSGSFDFFLTEDHNTNL